MTTPTDLIARYFALAPSTDRDAYVDLFAPDAVVEDEGRKRNGFAEIRAWRAEVPSVTYTVLSVVPEGTDEVAVASIAGDFPGSPVELRFAFRFTADGRIEHLAIRV
ncbi:MAG: hypothetical protein JWN20_51 [Jatrophihabitantaceae bacterium]|nr:hypothetical protein [Jatrophihabitantaceae bacterium]